MAISPSAATIPSQCRRCSMCLSRTLPAMWRRPNGLPRPAARLSASPCLHRRTQRWWRPSRRLWTSLWWRTSISTTRRRWRHWMQALTKSASIPATSAPMKMSKRWQTPATPKTCPSASASTAAAWKSISWPNTVPRCRRPWWKVRFTTSACWKNTISPTLWFPSNLPTCPA